ncbi:acetolactate synthase small subunit [Helicobacter sp. 12S02232-10]|uniref:acetolactate synthase small subunit n=1 Tax=Helicobacter sp. 12S02232-10 TaxID=1476197 RepID=UPI000BA79EA5|nr:acetolactate synthase small subunit [Helicobacter sp. 12S02232-10]PAF49414.1 acetolactate synthase small subunit [Helicobacter sp. 12S02232-10]
MQKRRIISVSVINEHGVLSRISGLFAGRGYNIESLTVAPIPETELSKVTIVTNGDERVLEQIVKQLHKLIPVLSVTENDDFLEKEMAMVKISIEEDIASIEALCRAYNGHVVNANEKYIIVAVTDKPYRIDSFLKAIKRFSPKEMVRSGVVALERY